MCNFCTLQRMRDRAKKEGKVVTLLPGAQGGYDVMVHAPDERVIPHVADDGNPQFRAWLWEVGDKCAC